MNLSRGLQIINEFHARSVVVLGDLMLDEFIWGEVRRISPEAPVPVVEVKRESWHLGGAGNVVSNILELGARAVPIGIVGDDRAASQMRDEFAKCKAETFGLVTDRLRPTTRKTRIVAHSQQMVRADREDRTPINEEIEHQVLRAFNTAIETADAVIISDYDKGLLTPRLLDQVISAARQKINPSASIRKSETSSTIAGSMSSHPIRSKRNARLISKSSMRLRSLPPPAASARCSIAATFSLPAVNTA
ncbi:MAG: hypothetical protein IPO77_07015 [Acidobacteria bacterium]|nr:hypothetical protein [Acidobacteriota bacterium]